MAVRAMRMDRRLAGRVAGAVDIEAEVFGLSPSARTPRWTPAIDPAMRRRFFAWARDHAPGAALYFVSAMPIAPSAVRDRLGRPVSEDARAAALFFVDEQPAANWGHACSYVFLSSDEHPLVVRHDFPPSRAIELVPIKPLRGYS